MGDNEKKRTVLSPAERVAKLEAELAEAKRKADAKAQLRIGLLLEQREKLMAQIDERSLKVSAIDIELESLGYVEGSVEDEPAEAPADEVENPMVVS